MHIQEKTELYDLISYPHFSPIFQSLFDSDFEEHFEVNSMGEPVVILFSLL
jgi:hypothetical protein